MLRFEQLSPRLMLTGCPYLDVDHNGLVEPIDVLIVINKLHQEGGAHAHNIMENNNSEWHDVNFDRFTTPADLVPIIDELNRQGGAHEYKPWYCTVPEVEVQTLPESEPHATTASVFSEPDNDWSLFGPKEESWEDLYTASSARLLPNA